MKRLHDADVRRTVILVPTLALNDGHEIIDFCFTPQDGNSLLSSVAAAAWLFDANTYEERLQGFQTYLFDEV